jgi:hypothetical protein
MSDKPKNHSQHSENEKLFSLPNQPTETQYAPILHIIKSKHNVAERQFHINTNLNKKSKNTEFFLIILLIALYVKFKSDKDIKIRASDSEKYSPSILIDSLIPPERAADMQANLADYFPIWVERHGLAKAHRIRKVQIALLIIGEYWNKAIELIKAVKLAGS